jgi:hypothetical protein
MKFDDVYKLPKPNGATDYNDSSHLAGMLAVTNHHKQVDCENYIVDRIVDRDTALAKYVRHPHEQRYDFSRDQYIPLACGLIAQNKRHMVNESFITGRDLLPPSVKGIRRRARLSEPYWYQKLWFKAEILWHSYLQPLDEPNQIICLCSVYGDEYLKLWTKHNKLWKWSLRRYWSQLDGDWRNEPELAEHIIEYVEKKTY